MISSLVANIRTVLVPSFIPFRQSISPSSSIGDIHVGSQLVGSVDCEGGVKTDWEVTLTIIELVTLRPAVLLDLRVLSSVMFSPDLSLLSQSPSLITCRLHWTALFLSLIPYHPNHQLSLVLSSGCLLIILSVKWCLSCMIMLAHKVVVLVALDFPFAYLLYSLGVD